MTTSGPAAPVTKPSMSLIEAAEKLGIGRTLAYDLHRKGEFPVKTYIAGRRKIRVATALVDAYMAGTAA